MTTETLKTLAYTAIERTLLLSLGMLHPDKKWSSHRIDFIEDSDGNVTDITVEFSVEEGGELIRQYFSAHEITMENSEEFLKALSEQQLG